jgi:hypothetical protein
MGGKQLRARGADRCAKVHLVAVQASPEQADSLTRPHPLSVVSCRSRSGTDGDSVNEGDAMNRRDTEAPHVGLGEFPFPLPKGRGESPYLVWLRNHSNYMATRGFLDYLGISGVLVRGILLNFLILLSLLLLVAFVIGHLYGPQLRSLPSLTDLPLGNLESLASKLKQPERPVDEWLAKHLSNETRAALKVYDDRPEDFQAALLKDLRDLVDGESIGDAEPLRSSLAALKAKEPRESRDRGSWARSMKALSGSSRSHVRLLNRQLLGVAYPEIKELDSATAGRLFDTGLLPPMPVPFTVTQSVLLLALLAILFSPIVVLYQEIAGHEKSTERAGSDSSVNRRDKFERRFGSLLLLILAFALFEALPVLVDRFHQFRVSPETKWDAIFASVAGVSVVVLGVSSKLLAVLGGAMRKLAMLLIGLLGVLAPLLVILYATDFVVYQEPYLAPEGNLLLALLPVGFVVGIGLAMLVGFVRKSFELVEYLRLIWLAGGVLIGTGVLAALVYWGVLQDESAPYIQHGWNHYFVFILAIELWLFCRLVLDVNQTSIHGLYRDRLASAYLMGLDIEGDVGIGEDVNLAEICGHEAGSTAPYHLVNAALNLQGSKDLSIRDRASDFFIFSKKFIGGRRTGYCRTETMEEVHPSMNVATAMAISAAAASPNMGRSTNPALVAFMVLLNIRLGYWLPNPGLLEEKLFGSWLARVRGERKAPPPGITFEEVFEQELVEIEKRWNNVYPNASDRRQRELHMTSGRLTTTPTTEHGLVGIGFSGGGIRSATINLGIAQALYEHGIFDHVDYMSTVSGGGYLGSSISTLMRCKSFHTTSHGRHSEIKGVVSLDTNAMGEKVVRVTGRKAPAEQREYRFSKFDPLVVETADAVEAGQELIERHNSLWDRFRWRVRPLALVREMMMRLDESHRWVNLSDGGHIENLAGIELLRRRCKLVILGDGEADPELHFNGLATLIRYARIDLGIDIDIHPDAIRLDKSRDAVDQGTDGSSREHWAVGTITYPPNEGDGQKQEEGYLLYLKSSFSGDEDEVIKEYRHRNPDFPHQSTADQFFDEDQFECHRALGQHIAEKALEGMTPAPQMTFAVFENDVRSLAKEVRTGIQSSQEDS